MNTYRWVQLLAVVPLLFLFACNATTEAPTSAPSSAAAKATVASKYSGVVDTANGRYTFAPISCAMYQEGDEMDIEIVGPGTAPDGEKVFVQFSSTANLLKIRLGVDTWSDSSDRTWEAGEFVTRKMKVDVSGKTIRVAELELVNEQGDLLSGSVEINC